MRAWQGTQHFVYRVDDYVDDNDDDDNDNVDYDYDDDYHYHLSSLQQHVNSLSF